MRKTQSRALLYMYKSSTSFSVTVFAQNNFDILGSQDDPTLLYRQMHFVLHSINATRHVIRSTLTVGYAIGTQKWQ